MFCSWMLCSAGRSMTCSGAALLVTCASAALIDVEPADSACTVPQPSMLATAGCEDDHSTSQVTSTVLPSDSSAVAANEPCWPTISCALPLTRNAEISTGGHSDCSD